MSQAPGTRTCVLGTRCALQQVCSVGCSLQSGRCGMASCRFTCATSRSFLFASNMVPGNAHSQRERGDGAECACCWVLLLFSLLSVHPRTPVHPVFGVIWSGGRCALQAYFRQSPVAFVGECYAQEHASLKFTLQEVHADTVPNPIEGQRSCPEACGTVAGMSGVDFAFV